MPHSKLILKARAAIIDNNRVVSPVCISIKDGVIVDIVNPGTPAVIPNEVRDLPNTTEILRFAQDDKIQLIDLGDMMLFPGFTNAHCHLELTEIGVLAEKPFIPWIGDLLAKKHQQTDTSKINSVRDGVALLKNSGVTTILDHVSFDTPVAAFENLPVRVIGFGEVLGVVREACLETIAAFENHKANATIPFYLSAHAAHTVHPEGLSSVWNKNQPRSVHLSESLAEVEFFKTGSGLFDELFKRIKSNYQGVDHANTTAINYLTQNNFNLDQTLLVHGNYFNATDFAEIEKNKSTCIVHCPRSHAFFGYDASPVEESLKRNIPIALGTDSITSNKALNILDELRLFLSKHPTLSWQQILSMLTTNALAAIGVDTVGKISRGFAADVIGFKTNSNEPLEILAAADKVDFVMSRGLI